METKSEVTPERIAANNQIILEMLRQLGGGRFLSMTGSKPLVKDNRAINPWVSFKLIRNKSKATHMKLIYNSGLDLYEMVFYRIWNFKMVQICHLVGLYSDGLESSFTHTTGLDTRL